MTAIKARHTDLDASILPLLGRTTKMLFIYLKQELEAASIDLTPKQWVVLKHLVDRTDVDQTHLAVLTERDKTSLTRLISTMEKKRLLERRQSEHDRRVKRLRITSEGRDVYQRSLPVVAKAIQSVQSGLSPSELTEAMETINRLNSNIRHLTK